jgi:hypothetical protein
MHKLTLAPAVLAGWLVLLVGSSRAAELKLFLPRERTAYQTNERIDLALVRNDKDALKAGDLSLKVKGDDASELVFTLAVPEGKARRVEHVYLNGWLLRPGKYTLEAACDGATAKTSLEVFSHVRRSSFRLVNWGGRAAGTNRLPEGEEGLGYNLFMGEQPNDENLIRAGVDYMRVCTMSGGHQMDLRQECDWSDPLVIQGGTRRVVRQALADRSRPNVLGVHFYDEPGLTWLADPQTKEATPHAIPSQQQAYEAAFGKPPISYRKVDPKNPQDVAQWRQWARWKLGFMDAAWKDAQLGVSAVRPDYLSITQSQYGYSAFTDGYYFNVVRSLPLISGHGGYHDFGPGYFNPSLFLEFARARDLARPNWYLPCWYGSTTSDELRLEQYLAFQTNIQGLMTPPEIDPWQPDKLKAAQGTVESNHLMARLGTIFTTMRVTRPPVAVLFSLSQMIHTQTQDRHINYAHETEHGRKLVFTYLAGKLLQQQFMPVLDEDVRDGTLAAEHRALILTSIDYLDPEVIAGIEAFIRQGGLVILTADCKVKVNGAFTLDVAPRFPQEERVNRLLKEKKYQDMAPLVTLREHLKGAEVLARALHPYLEKAKIEPPIRSSEPGIVVTRQTAGDIEYLFAVNASHDPKGQNAQLAMKAVTAKLALPTDRPVYDAVHGGLVKVLAPTGKWLEGSFRFGPGQMRVFARTARPIDGVSVARPILHRDYNQKESPLSVEIGAGLLARHQEMGSRDLGLLSGSAPLRIRLLDPLGAVRYDLYRATDRGTLRLNLPLALNDPAGDWTVEVTELLDNHTGQATFTLPAASTCSIAAGTARRAISLPEERDHVFRFFRTHQRITVVKGTAPEHAAAAERLQKILRPWNIECTVIDSATANKPRVLRPEEAETFAGIEFTGRGAVKPGDKNNPALVGFAIRGPAILLGMPEDNLLIKYLLDARYLPMTPSKTDLPGPGRGLIAWQRDAIGATQESIALIGYDAQGINEAIGTMYEMLAGIEPLTPWALARASTITAAKKKDSTPVMAEAWSRVLGDRIVGLKSRGDKLSALTHAGAQVYLGKDGKVLGEHLLEDAARAEVEKEMTSAAPAADVATLQKQLGPSRLVKLIARSGTRTAVAFWGGVIHVLDDSEKVVAVRHSAQDVTALVWAGDQLLAGDADGRLVALRMK